MFSDDDINPAMRRSRRAISIQYTTGTKHPYQRSEVRYERKADAGLIVFNA